MASLCNKMSADQIRRLVSIARHAISGDSYAVEQFAGLCNQWCLPKAAISEVIRLAALHDQASRIRRHKRRVAQEKAEKPRFAPTHPLFRAQKRKNGRSRTDAMYRAVLCGGFETNRARH